MSNITKSKLKASRDAITSKKYDQAKEAARAVLDYEPDNYNANIYLGKAALELGELEESEQAYQRAIATNPKQILAFQGISQLYERTGKWEKYAGSLLRLAVMYIDTPEKCAETLQKYIALQRERGTPTQISQALRLLLPGSEYYDTLSSLPAPDHTNPTSTTTHDIQCAMYNSLPVLQEIVSILEAQETSSFNVEVDKQRQRLGAPGLDQIKLDVRLEMSASSQLPSYYDDIINHAHTSDELRRETEFKLIRMKQEYLFAIPTSNSDLKKSVATEVHSLADGAVVLGIPDEISWLIVIETKNTSTVEGYDLSLLRRFMALFPALPLTGILKGYFMYMTIPLSKDDDDVSDDEEKHHANGDEEEDPFELILDCYDRAKTSVLANKIMADVYVHEEDFQHGVQVSEEGIRVTRKLEASYGEKLDKVTLGFHVSLSTSLVHLFPPKHHARAQTLIDRILKQDSENVSALMGRGYILQAEKQWDEAADVFQRCVSLTGEDSVDHIRAAEEAVWCQSRTADGLVTATDDLKTILVTLEALPERSVDRARCLWRIGTCHWDMDGAARDESFMYFVRALKQSSAFAPAFTSLGVYYAEQAAPPDPVRASKCFQKAFELDAREVEAGRRLAEGFAEEGSWDLVDVIARRTIEGEGGLDAGISQEGRAALARARPANGWAWKALGVVELTQRNYPDAIEAFQIALRAHPDDHTCWLRLGESYGKAGRHAAALKALERAQELHPDDWMCAYLIGDIQYQIGQYKAAIDIFESILQAHSEEVGVLASLAQTRLDLGLSEAAEGFIARAEETFTEAIHLSAQIIQYHPGFRRVAWKVCADAIFYISKRPVPINAELVFSTLQLVISLLPDKHSKHISGIISPSPLPEESSLLTGLHALEVAALAYDYPMALALEETIGGSSWFDLGMILRSWATRTMDQVKKERAEKHAIACFTNALREEPSNDACWIALADAHFIDQPKIAQHAYIKAIEIASKNVVPWTNLGLLYLYHDDIPLANEALHRAQTLDPDHTVAWIGQFIVAMKNKHENDAATLLEHAFEINTDTPDVDFQFALHSFFVTNMPGTIPTSESLLPIFFALDRYCKQRPNDACALHLFALVCESMGHIENGASLITRAIDILEAAYEESEDANLERQFTIATCNRARMQLSLGDYAEAIAGFESVVGLLSGDEEPVDIDTVRVLKTQSHFCSALAHLKSGDMAAGLVSFEAALESSSGDDQLKNHVTVLLSQALWFLDTDESKESAKTQLLECIAEDPENLTAITILAGMGILTEDESLVDAALTEIISLEPAKQRKLDPQRDVQYLLMKHYIGQNNIEQAISVAQNAVHAEPSEKRGHVEMAELMLQLGKSDDAAAILSGIEITALSPKMMALKAVVGAHSADPHTVGMTIRAAQKAVMLSPNDPYIWRAFAFTRCRYQAKDVPNE
ncbi:hypothetical protein FISHEDRAFT_69529 [Fistulina hepatica ATCC 64428]|uniref:TPR-like protein n=1 Tax=Fistulina hepatica ATCC 64428 TaxID=1128425 RepID=A0A0D7ALU7_9AGAR|nr:hypothetical protein FISHEDRAFT_69529 [Fistulina hepatica ATCC 64428]